MNPARDGFWQSSTLDGPTALYVQRTLVHWALNDPATVAGQFEWSCCPPVRAAMLMSQLAGVLSVAATVLWDAPIMQAAFAGQANFVDVPLVPNLCPDRPQLWFLVNCQLWAGYQEIFEVPADAQCEMVLLTHVAGADENQYMAGLMKDGHPPPEAMTGRHGLGITLIWNRTFDDPGKAAAAGPAEGLPYFRALPSLYVGEKIYSQVAAAVAGLSFLALPFVGTEQVVPVSRQQRRAAERSRREPPDVRTVILRRKNADLEPDGSAQPGETTREYHCRWLVGAHWRRRNERWKNGEGPIFIAPYLKGPEGKEFRAPRKTVFAAKR